MCCWISPWFKGWAYYRKLKHSFLCLREPSGAGCSAVKAGQHARRGHLVRRTSTQISPFSCLDVVCMKFIPSLWLPQSASKGKISRGLCIDFRGFARQFAPKRFLSAFRRFQWFYPNAFNFLRWQSTRDRPRDSGQIHDFSLRLSQSFCFRRDHQEKNPSSYGKRFQFSRSPIPDEHLSNTFRQQWLGCKGLSHSCDCCHQNSVMPICPNIFLQTISTFRRSC
jgi:hypothetical protein